MHGGPEESEAAVGREVSLTQRLHFDAFFLLQPCSNPDAGSRPPSTPLKTRPHEI